jgi:type IV pilus assembly protein PilX
MFMLSRQKGAVLVVSLIILLVLTLIGVSAARTVLLEEKMTFASRDAKVALEVAEALIRQGETYIDSITTTGDFGTTGWRRAQGEGPTDLLAEATWTNTNSQEREVAMKGPDGSSKMKGRIYIELAGNADKEDPANDITVGGYGESTGGGEIKVFRIVTLGRGISPGTTRILVSHYGKRF